MVRCMICSHDIKYASGGKRDARLDEPQVHAKNTKNKYDAAVRIWFGSSLESSQLQPSPPSPSCGQLPFGVAPNVSKQSSERNSTQCKLCGQKEYC